MTQKFTSDDAHSDASKTSGTSATSALAQAASTGKDAIQSATRELTGEVSHFASDIAGEAKKAAEIKLGAGKDFAVEHLGSVADALRKTSKSLGSENVATSYMEKAAGSVDSVSEYFQTRTLSQLVNDVEGYARREPAVFLGGAFFMGMLGGRFLKAATPSPAQGQGQGHGQHQGQGGLGQSNQGQGGRNGNDGQRSQGNRQGGNGHDNHNRNQNPDHNQGQQHQGIHSQSSSGSGGQGNKPGNAGQAKSSVATGSATGASDKSPDKSSSDKSSFAERATEPGSTSPEAANRPGKGSGAS